MVGVVGSSPIAPTSISDQAASGRLFHAGGNYMENRWQDAALPTDLLQQRVYSSRLLGADPTLVLHGGGNTSVKGIWKDIFGADVPVLYVKGSGSDLATIVGKDFSPVRLEALLNGLHLYSSA